MKIEVAPLIHSRLRDASSDRTQFLSPQISLQQQVIEIIAKSLDRFDAKRIGPCASLTRDLRADALDRIEVITALENSFGIRISDRDAERIDTVRDAVDYVYHALNRRAR